MREFRIKVEEFYGDSKINIMELKGHLEMRYKTVVIVEVPPSKPDGKSPYTPRKTPGCASRAG